MKRKNPANIQVTMNLLDILNKFSGVLFEEITEKPPKSNSEFQELVEKAFNRVLFPADLGSAKLKYNEPKLQFAKSGPIGESSYAAPIERQDYARRKPAKSYQLTPARMIQQSRMQQAISAWKSTDPTIQAQWEKAAFNMHMAGVHLFRGIYITRLVDNLPIPDPFLPTQEILQYYYSR